MGVAKARYIGRIATAGLWMTVLASPAFAQEGGGGLSLVEMVQTMGATARAVAVVLFVMSFWSIGVAIERFYTYNQARKQSKLYAPQVAKHLKDGRLKEAIALSGSKDFRYSHLAKVVLAGLQEYQFQQESGGAALNREDVLDTVRRSIQRATALTSSDLKKGVTALATIGSTAPFVGLLGTVIGIIRSFHELNRSQGKLSDTLMSEVGEALVATAIGIIVAIPAVAFFNFFQHTRQIVADEDGDDSRRCFVRTETVIVARVSDRGSQQLRVLVHALRLN